MDTTAPKVKELILEEVIKSKTAQEKEQLKQEAKKEVSDMVEKKANEIRDKKEAEIKTKLQNAVQEKLQSALKNKPNTTIPSSSEAPVDTTVPDKDGGSSTSNSGE